MRTSALLSDFSAGEISKKLYGRVDQPVYYKGCSVMDNFVPMLQGGFRKRMGTLRMGHTVTDLAARLYPFIVSQTYAYVLEFTNNSVRAWRDGVLKATVATTYTTAEIPNLQFATISPDLFIVHPNHAPARLRWTTPDTLTLANLTITTDTVEFTATRVSGTATLKGVTTTDLPIGSTWFLTGTGITAGTYITGIAATAGTSPLTYTVTMSGNATASGTSTITATLQPAPFGSAGNYPRCVGTAFQRLWFANTTNDPQEFWGSIVGVWDASDPGGTTGKVCFAWSDLVTYTVKVMQTNADGSPTTNPPTYLPSVQARDIVGDASAIDFTIFSELNDEVMWIAAGKDLFTGTASGEYVFPGSTSPNTIEVQLVSRSGCTANPGVLLSGGFVFVQMYGKRVMRINWQGTNNPMEPPSDLTFFSDHLFSTYAIAQYDYTQAPECMLYFLRSDGTLVGCLYNPLYGVQAWYTFTTLGTITGLAVVPGTNRDVLYLAVTRGASTYIEQLQDPDWTDGRQAVFLDCATYKYNAVAFTTVTCDTAQNGETFTLYGDGAYIGTAVVTAGVITLPIACNYAVVGKPFTSRMQTLPVEVAGSYGAMTTKIKAIPAVHLRLVSSMYVKVGYSSSATYLENVPLGAPPIVVSTGNPTLFTGDVRSTMRQTFARDACVNVVSDLPLPLTITALVPEIEGME